MLPSNLSLLSLWSVLLLSQGTGSRSRASAFLHHVSSPWLSQNNNNLLLLRRPQFSLHLSKFDTNETSTSGKVRVNIRLNSDKATRFSSGSFVNGDTPSSSSTTNTRNAADGPLPVHSSVSHDAGPLWEAEDGDDATIIPHRGQCRKRVLVLCTGGTLTMCNDPAQGNSLAPVQGALTNYLAGMRELTEDPEMPEIVSHEYTPLIDSSDMVSIYWCRLFGLCVAAW